MRTPIALAIAALLVVGGAGCATDDADDATDPTTTTVASAAVTTSASDAAATTTSTTAPDVGVPRIDVGDVLTERYCEVLTVTVGEDATTAEVWGTQAVSDCPQELLDTVDPAAVAADLGVTAAIVNGPRFWLLDGIAVVEMAGSGEVHDFGDLPMRSIAQVDLGAGIPDRTPYTETSVVRDTQFFFDAGTTVHELTAPDGSIYVMQSFSVQVDPDLTREALADLDERLELPEGWTFTTRTLDEDLVVEDLDGVATVLQDELQNTYQLRQRG